MKDQVLNDNTGGLGVSKYQQYMGVIKDADKMKARILKVFEASGPSCHWDVITEIYGCKYLDKEYMAVMPDMVLLLQELMEEHKLICDDEDDPESPLRLPNQQQAVSV